MVPIFSPRSLLSIFLGLILGAGLGLGYYSFGKDASAELKAGWPPIQIVQIPDSTKFESTIQGRIMPQVPDDTYLRDMDSEGQYYAAKMNSMSFFEYFSNVISKLNPQYAQNPEQLALMVNVTYVTLADNPSVIQIKASFPSSQETLFILQTMPKVFEAYMQDEQNSLQAEIYQNKLKQVDITRKALLQAGQNLIDSTTLDVTPPTTLTKDYVQLSAKVATLQDELNLQSKKAADLLAGGFAPDSSQPQATPAASGASAAQNTNPAVLDAQIKALEDALAFKQRTAAGYVYSTPPDYPSTTYNITDEAINQAYTQASEQIYTNTINAMENISTELSKAKVEMDKLQAQAAQEKAAKDNSNEQKKLQYTFANSQITSLTAQLDAQTKDLLATNQTVPSSQIPKFYATAAPLEPLPVNPAKNAPILGAVFGMICGWLIINRKWFFSGTSKSHISVDEEEDDEISPRKRMVTTPESNNGKEEDDDWLNESVPKIPDSAIKKEDDDWLNTGIDKVSNSLIKKEDDEWLNAGINKISENAFKGKDDNRPNSNTKIEPEATSEKSNSSPSIKLPNITLEGDVLKDDSER